MPRYPKDLLMFIQGLHSKKDRMGMGNSYVRVFVDKPWVLKVFYNQQQGLREIAVLSWLHEQHIPVPQIIHVTKTKTRVYLLMTKFEGLMSCDPSLMQHPKKVIDVLSTGIKLLQKIDINDCPFPLKISDRLKMAKAYLDRGEVDMNTWDPEIIQGRFQTPYELYDYLVTHQPKEDLVFVHGDYCLPNIFIQDHRLEGFIDLGLAGIADKHLDIALCMRSIKYNFRTDRYKDLLYQLFDFDIDETKIDYYLLLDELF